MHQQTEQAEIDQADNVDVEGYRLLVVASDVDPSDVGEGVIALRDRDSGQLFLVRRDELTPPGVMLR